ncbi:MAG TPA: LacI family DNA-binding transcriptional regulator [Ktedonobacterales bacterium]|jgi:LacI family transcriptional regulator|nr:LacI family DNA-binding transcriptional regulator [Ktedonobacterales bacterium]
MPITLKQLSLLAGAHPSTVARVLHADPRQRVSAELRERILALAREHDYRPNSVARSLRTKRTAVVGVLIPDIANPFFASVLRGMEDAAAERDYSIILSNTDDQPAREAHGMAMLRDRQVDGLLLATARLHDPAIAQLAQGQTPFVLVNRHTEPVTPNAVVPDDYAGGVAAIEHLLELGHQRIAHIAGADDTSTGFMREQAYRDTLRLHGADRFADQEMLLVRGSFREAGGYTAMQTLLDLAEPPTAVFAVNDLAALGAIHAINEASLRVPEDISVIGFNDLFHASHMTPSLTTVQVPHRAMGVRAAERLLSMIVDGVMPESPLLLPVTLIARQSTGPAPQRRPSARTRHNSAAPTS